LLPKRCTDGLEHCFNLGPQPRAEIPRDVVARDRQQLFNLDAETLARRDCSEQDSFALRIIELASGAFQ
jgi:hypothetical protein